MGTFLARPNAKTHTPQRKTCLHLLQHPRKSSRSARRRPRPWPTKKSHNALLVGRHYASRPRRNRSEIWRKATWKAKSVGASLVEDDKVEVAKSLMAEAEKKGVKLLLPTDVVVADKFAADANTKVVSVDEIPEGWMGLDI